MSAATSEGAGVRGEGLRIAYTMSRFPKLSETFVLDEMIDLERLGVHIEVLPLIRHDDGAQHPAAGPFVDRAHYCTPLQPKVLAANAAMLARRPRRYLSTLATLLWGVRRSRDFLAKSLVAFPQAVWFATVVEDLDIDHVHAHFATHATTAAWVVNRLTGVSYSFTGHAHDIYLDQTFLDRKLADASLVVAISQFARDLLVSIEPSAAPHVVVVHCGIDVGRFEPSLRHPADRFTIVNIGRLDPMKGQVHLIDAARILADRGLDFELRIIGGGDLHDSLADQVARLGLGDRVTLLGGRPRDVVVDEVHRAHVAASSSVVTPAADTEGLPISLIESMSAGVPTVATRVAGVPELITDRVNGLLVDQGDPVALADAIEEIATDADLAARLSANGRAEVLAHFDEQVTSRQLLAHFAEVVGAGRGRADRLAVGAMNVVVTGAAGFIGSTLVDRLLAEGHQVRGIDAFTDYYDPAAKRANLTAALADPAFTLVEGDLNELDLPATLADAEVIWHLAGQPGVRLSWSDGFAAYDRRNVLATQRVLEAAKVLDTPRVVYASSSSVYGNAERYPTLESDRPEPVSPYGVTKLAGEHLCVLYAYNWGLSTASLRYFTVYGPRQRPDMACHRLIEAALDQTPFPMFGDGGQIRTFTYVGDVVDATYRAGVTDVTPGTVLNVSGVESSTLAELIDLVGHHVGRAVPLDRLPPSAGDAERTGGSTERIEAELGWTAATSLDRGVEAQVAWHRSLRA